MFFYIYLRGKSKNKTINPYGIFQFKCKEKSKPLFQILFKKQKINKKKLKIQLEKRNTFSAKIKRLAQRDARWLYKRTFVYPPFLKSKLLICESGELCIEAALSLPAFALIMVSFMYLFMIIGTDLKVLNAMENTATEINNNIALIDFDEEVLASDLGIKALFVNEYGLDELNDSCIKNGSLGIDVGKSEYDSERKMLKMVVAYKIKMPQIIGSLITIKRKQILNIRLFAGEAIEKTDEEYVYIAANGEVYHKDINCTYLKTDIIAISYGELTDARNNSGGKYKACDICGQDLELEIVEGAYISPDKELYITKNGDKYHTSLECYTLNRTFERVKLSDTNLLPCSKCSEGE